MIDHELKGLSVISIGAGVPIINKSTIILPFRIPTDLLLVLVFLQLDRHDLVQIICTDSAVRSHGKDTLRIQGIINGSYLVDILSILRLNLRAQRFLCFFTFGGESHIACHLRASRGIIEFASGSFHSFLMDVVQICSLLSLADYSITVF